MHVHYDNFEESIINCLLKERYEKACEIDIEKDNDKTMDKNEKCLCNNVTIKSTIEFDLTLPEEWDEKQVLSFAGSEIGTLGLFGSINDMEIVSIKYPIQDETLYKQICSYMRVQKKYFYDILKQLNIAKENFRI